MLKRIRWQRAFVAGLAGGVAFVAGLFAFFGPAQQILANPDFQSPKMMAVFFELEPLPRSGSQPVLVTAGFLGFGMLHAFLFALLAPGLPGRGWAKGLSFGLVMWCAMILWFEFYLLWNVLHEPGPLILLELALWMGVMLAGGIAIALVYRPDRSDGKETPE